MYLARPEANNRDGASGPRWLGSSFGECAGAQHQDDPGVGNYIPDMLSEAGLTEITVDKAAGAECLKPTGAGAAASTMAGQAAITSSQ